MITQARDQTLAAILAGDRTKTQIAARLGIDLTPVTDYRDPADVARYAPALALFMNLGSLVSNDLIYMKVVDRDWHHLPTKKALEAT